MIYKSVKGMNDILPAESARWQFLEQTARSHFSLYGYAELRTPIVEPTKLFQRSVGESTDIVTKEMYTFEDKGGEFLTLRPEGTAAVARSVLEHNLINTTSPHLKVFYLGPMYRRERPQKGRFRQFHQIGAENFGSLNPASDAEVIEMLARLFNKLGIEGLILSLNSLGEGDERKNYEQILREFLAKNSMGYCVDCQQRILFNPLRVLDCKNSACRQLVEGHPVILDFLGDESRTHFELVQKILTSFKIPFEVNPRMVRGLDYYQRTVFEFTSAKLGAQSALAAGGRYDSLIKDLGGPDIPGIGFALGVERLLLLLPEKLEEKKSRKIFIAFLGGEARSRALLLACDLRNHGYQCEMNYDEKSLKSQMRWAEKLGSSHVVIVGENEIRQNRVIVKNYATKEQVEVCLDELPGYFKRQT